jgi:hypothetical protein
VGSRQTHLLQQACLLKVHLGTCPSPFLQSTQGICPFCYMSFSVPCFLFSFFSPRWGHTVHRAMLVYPRVGCGNTTCHLFAHLLVCVSQEG